MKTLKTIGFACALILASGKMFAQSADKKTQDPQKSDAVQQNQPASDEDPLMAFFKNYQSYIENQKTKASTTAAASTNNLTKSQTKLVQADVAAHLAAQEVQNIQAAHPGANIGFQQMQATQANMNFLDAKTNNQIVANGPATVQPAQATLSDKEQMLKKALAEKEKLDKQNAESTEKPAN